MSQIKLKHSGGNGVIIAAPSSNPAADRTLLLPGDGDSTIDTLARAGNILQVVQTFKTDSVSITSSSYVDITGMTLSITPQSSSNKILLDVNLNAGGGNNMYAGINVMRDSTAIGVSTAMSLSSQVNASFAAYTDSGGNSDVKAYNFGFRHLDSPNTTSATTYKLQVYTRSAVEFTLNRPTENDNEVYMIGQTSAITAYEVAA